LSNVYLHYALDLWFGGRVKPQARGEAYYFRFADDFLVCFENQDDARRFRQRLEDRLEGFGLQVAEDKIVASNLVVLHVRVPGSEAPNLRSSPFWV
jgi:hypothetical protein